MKSFKAHFEIAEDINCPLYRKGEFMLLTDKTFSCPQGKEVCLILVRDMTQLLFSLLKEKQGGDAGISSNLFSCSGCTGLIKFREIEAVAPASGQHVENPTVQIDSAMQKIHGRSVQSEFLNSLPADKILPVLQKFQGVVVPAETILVHQGEPNPNLYLVMTGAFEVENRGERIATLAEGELFGEMSYLGSGEAIASVRALEDSSVLAVTAEDFCELLSSSSSVQSYMARLLADRLQQINAARGRDFESSMSGKLEDVVPAELFQVFHMHQKSGVLIMTLAGGEARVAFREGGIVYAGYKGLKNEDAIYEMLAEKGGYYRFTAGLDEKEMNLDEIGDFMGMLMEGIKRVDEVDNDEMGED